ncbi:MAG: tRNA (adenosine(37)-N6)-threonylcarbamoyltransferase complex dimerization subunit type 1 TsaB [Nitrospirae bacterium]|nr:MAG: tRNA (adenosine(37)-N6)-threonylcarbamoyltransferase complex dimerization subunit type 1 TsaB [Nitrospirota bacterium]
MRLLAIETATPAQSVAVVEGDRLLAELSYEAKGNRGGMLLPTVDQVLKQAGVAAGDLDAVAVSVGPGSFTGLRVGLATAKGLALGSSARLVGVPTLEALAEGYASGDGTVCALLDAYRGEVYMALFKRQGHTLERLSPDAVLAPEAAVSAVAAVEGPVHLIGNGAARYRERLQAALGSRACMTDEGLRAVPSAAVVARLGLQQLAGGHQPDAEVALLYLRRAEAEVNWEKGLLKPPLTRVAR